MRLCHICHRRPSNSRTSSQCRQCHRDYMREWRGPSKVSKKDKARAWLKGGIDNRQLAELLGISRKHAATLRYQLKRER